MKKNIYSTLVILLLIGLASPEADAQSVPFADNRPEIASLTNVVESPARQRIRTLTGFYIQPQGYVEPHLFDLIRNFRSGLFECVDKGEIKFAYFEDPASGGLTDAKSKAVTEFIDKIISNRGVLSDFHENYLREKCSFVIFKAEFAVPETDSKKTGEFCEKLSDYCRRNGFYMMEFFTMAYSESEQPAFAKEFTEITGKYPDLLYNSDWEINQNISRLKSESPEPKTQTPVLSEAQKGKSDTKTASVKPNANAAADVPARAPEVKAIPSPSPMTIAKAAPVPDTSAKTAPVLDTSAKAAPAAMASAKTAPTPVPSPKVALPATPVAAAISSNMPKPKETRTESAAAKTVHSFDDLRIDSGAVILCYYYDKKSSIEKDLLALLSNINLYSFANVKAGSKLWLVVDSSGDGAAESPAAQQISRFIDTLITFAQVMKQVVNDPIRRESYKKSFHKKYAFAIIRASFNYKNMDKSKLEELLGYVSNLYISAYLNFKPLLAYSFAKKEANAEQQSFIELLDKFDGDLQKISK